MTYLMQLRGDVSSVKIVGGKGASLQRLVRAGAPVPPAWAIAAAAFEAHLQHPAVAAALREAESTKQWAPVRRAIADAPVSDVLLAALTECGAQPGVTWAVRSSAVDEDGQRHSFAGQHDSLLQVDGAALAAAVRTCWASAFSERAMAYRARNGGGRPVMAVVLQHMVDAECAGVLFTTDPTGAHRDTLILEAVKGLGEALVSGTVAPQRWRITRGTHVFSERPVEPPLLTDAAVRDLCARAVALETEWKAPLDLEWALADGRPWLLQARPITTSAKPSRVLVWTNTNTGELMPDVATPLSFSLVERFVSALFRGLLTPFGISLGAFPIVGRVGGRLYFCLNTLLALLRVVPGLARRNPAEFFGGNPDAMRAAVERLKPEDVMQVHIEWLTFFSGIFTAVRSMWRARNVESEAILAGVRAAVSEQLQGDPRRLSEVELAGHIREAESAVFGPDRGFFTLMVGMACLNAVAVLTAKWLGDATGALAGRLLSGLGGMASADAGHALFRLAANVRGTALQPVLEASAPWGETRATLEASEAGRAFLSEFDAFHRRYGHHARGEIDVAVPRWSEQPEATLATLRAFLGAMPADPPEAVHARRQRERLALEADVAKRLGWPRRAVFASVLGRAHQALVLRENLKSLSIECIAAVRRHALEAGNRLSARGVLSTRDDVFLLSLDELDAVLRGGVSPSLDELERRRRELETFRHLTPPELVVGSLEASAPARPPNVASGNSLTGLAVSPGVVEGVARVVLRADETVRVAPGEILVAPFTDPGWTPYFVAAAAVVVDVGGMLSHGSIVAREYGIPAVVNVGSATTWVKTGQRIRVDGDRGVVTLVDPPVHRG
ncbi:MAG: hypothetical protein JNG84_12010 [Archangium sp.]|nr:hypothetical protein [Archangium sp.]